MRREGGGGQWRGWDEENETKQQTTGNYPASLGSSLPRAASWQACWQRTKQTLQEGNAAADVFQRQGGLGQGFSLRLSGLKT